MIELRQSTAGQEVPLGYFLDSADGNTEETGLTIANTDIKIWKWGATTLANKNSGGATHISNGVYYCTLDATDTDTLGALVIFVHVSGSLVVRLECAVLTANAWDSKYSTDKLQVDAVEVSGTAQTAGDLKTLIDTVDSIADAIKAKTDNLPADPADDSDIDAQLATIAGYIDTEITSIINHLTDIKGGTFNGATDSLEAIRDRGDAAWVTGGGGSITQMIYPVPLIPRTIDLADTATVRIGIGIINMLDDLPTTAEITPGTITIDRKAVGGSSWTNVVNAAACSEAAGLVYYDEVFDSGTGYRPGDTIRITFKGQKVTVDANDHELVPTDGWIFHSEIRGAERTDTANAIHTYTVLDGNGNGIADVLVEAKIQDTNILVQSARTNSSGVATFYLAAGTYDFYATKAGYSFTNPDTETVS